MKRKGPDPLIGIGNFDPELEREANKKRSSREPRKKEIHVRTCEFCGRWFEWYRSPKQLERDGTPRFCSRSCATSSRGKKNL